MKQVIVKNEFFQEKEDYYVSYFQKISVPVAEKLPKVKWKCGKISQELWNQFVLFSLASYDKHKSESLVLFFFDTKNDEWDMWAPPQQTRGMTVELLDKHKDYEEQRKQFSPMLFGTGHHHCGASAFQSGTDEADERGKEGVHFTLGKLDNDILDIHARFVLDGKTYEVDISTIVEYPEEFDCIPYEDIKETTILRYLGDTTLENVNEADLILEVETMLGNVYKDSYEKPWRRDSQERSDRADEIRENARKWWMKEFDCDGGNHIDDTDDYDPRKDYFPTE